MGKTALAGIGVFAVLTMIASLPSEAMQTGGPPSPKTLQELCDKSALVVDASVQSISPPFELPQSPYRFTDSIMSVQRVIRGAEQSQQVVIDQRGIPLDKRMKVGERYILFLTSNLGGLRQLAFPQRGNASRYLLVVKVGVVDGIVQFPKDLPKDFERLQGLKPEQLISEIQACTPTPGR